MGLANAGQGRLLWEGHVDTLGKAQVVARLQCGKQGLWKDAHSMRCCVQ